MRDKIGAQAACGRLSGWRPGEGSRDVICKTFKFADFKTAWAFMCASALKAEQMDHHPEWFNVYSTVEVTLTTHDALGVSELDVTLATYMDELAPQLGQ